MNPQQISVQEAFDRHANNYDLKFSDHALGENIRSEVWQIADQAFALARRVLDLGAGTGEDAIHFARKGVQVTAVDVSSEMVSRLKAKAMASGVLGKIDPVVSEMPHYSPPGPEFDGIISNFGALNCLSDLSWLRELAQRGLKPGARLIFTTMGSFYPLETAVLFLKGRFRSAFRRFLTPCEVSVEGVPVRVYYHSLRSMRTMLGAQFSLESVTGLRAFRPVPGWEHLGASNIFRWLAPIDRLWCRWRFTAPYSDHFITIWRYEP